MRPFLRFGAACACAWLVACQAPASTGASCAHASDCVEPLTCAFGRCRAACREARDCPAGSRCIVGPAAGVCALDEENHCDTVVCPSPLVCVADQCRTACVVDRDCVAGPCTSGTCEEPSHEGHGAPVARLISSAFFTDWFGPTYGSAGMSRAGYQVSSDGVHDGELLVLIGCVDNGSTTVWPSPLAPGFTQIAQTTWGSDQQTCVVDWRIAASEPPTYTGTYGQGVVSGAAVIALIAITGARAMDPIASYLIVPGAAGNADPVALRSEGLTTTAPDTLVLYAGSADWTCSGAHGVSATVPNGFTTLLALGDHGSETCDWTWLQIDAIAVHDAGPTGAITSTQTSTPACTGSSWTAAIAIAP